MDPKMKEGVSRLAHRLRVDEWLESEVKKYCAHCGEKLPTDEPVFTLVVPGPEEDDEWEMTEVYCRKCVTIDPNRKKRVNPHPAEE